MEDILLSAETDLKLSLALMKYLLSVPGFTTRCSRNSKGTSTDTNIFAPIRKGYRMTGLFGITG